MATFQSFAFLNAPLLIVAGQCYLHKGQNEYVIITKFNRGQVQYVGKGFRGCMDGYEFIEQFPPVDPLDIDPDEIQDLLSMCPEDVLEATTGFISEFDEEDAA